MSIKNFSVTIRNRTRYLPACSRVPQPTAPPRTCYFSVWRQMQYHYYQDTHDKCYITITRTHTTNTISLLPGHTRQMQCHYYQDTHDKCNITITRTHTTNTISLLPGHTRQMQCHYYQDTHDKCNITITRTHATNAISLLPGHTRNSSAGKLQTGLLSC
jgi:hypothetical protein